jgi:hypothetical protein
MKRVQPTPRRRNSDSEEEKQSPAQKQAEEARRELQRKKREEEQEKEAAEKRAREEQSALEWKEWWEMFNKLKPDNYDKMTREKQLEFQDDVNKALAYERDRPSRELERKRRTEEDEKEAAEKRAREDEKAATDRMRREIGRLLVKTGKFSKVKRGDDDHDPLEQEIQKIIQDPEALRKLRSNQSCDCSKKRFSRKKYRRLKQKSREVSRKGSRMKSREVSRKGSRMKSREVSRKGSRVKSRKGSKCG